MERILKVNSWFQIQMKFEFPSQIFVSKYRYSQGNVQVKQALVNYQDDRYIENIKQAPQRKIRNILLCPHELSVVRCFVPRETRLLLFLNSSPINSKDWTTAYFEQFVV